MRDTRNIEGGIRDENDGGMRDPNSDLLKN